MPDDRDRSQAEVNNEFRQIITRLIHGEPRTGPSVTDQVRALFAKHPADEPVRQWCLLWGFELDDEQVALAAGFIEDGWRFGCGVHRTHDFDVRITKRHITVNDIEHYGETEVRRLAAMLEGLVEGKVDVIRFGGTRGLGVLGLPE